MQAIHGFLILALGSGRNEQFVTNYTQHTYEWIENIRKSDQFRKEDYLLIVEENRKAFDEFAIQVKINLPIFSASSERLWRLFMERYNITTQQLRADLYDILTCFDINILSESFRQTPDYFRRLPLSTELILAPWQSGIRTDLVIPPRILVLDMILMLCHAYQEHRIVESSSDGIQYQHNGRLDSYARQVLIVAATVCDNILSEYGYTLESTLSRLGNSSDILTQLASLRKRGVTARLQLSPKTWSECLGRAFDRAPECVSDMISLVEIRNRLVHPDGRLNCWHAFQLDPGAWNFSGRLNQYLNQPVPYRIPNSHIGLEVCLAHFCVDTVILTIDYFHSIIFLGEVSAPWLNLARTRSGGLDLEQAISNEVQLRNINLL
jgi:hypothetical protein